VAQQLAEYTVDLVVKGFQAFQNQLKTAKGQLEAMQRAAEAGARAAALGFAAGAASLAAFVRAGLQGTTMGEALARNVQALSREVAAVFSPAIQAAIAKLREAVAWFRGLSAEQQDQVQKWSLVTLGALGLVAALPKLVAVGGAVVTVFQGIAAAGAAMAAANPFAWVAAGAVALVALVASTEKGRAAFARLWEAARPSVTRILDTVTRLTEMISGPLLAGLETYADALATAFERVLPHLEKVFKIVEFLVANASVLGFVAELAGGGGEFGRTGAATPPKPPNDHRQLNPIPSGPEAVTATFARIQGAAVKTSFERTAEKQLDVQRQIEQNTRKGGGRGGLPAVGQQ
jgi:hypothetical protein